jgi:hypothetical protein
MSMYENNLTRNPAIFTAEEEATIASLKVEENGYVSIGTIANIYLGEQSQYVSRHFEGNIQGFPALFDGLDFYGTSGNYHSWRVLQSDVKPFLIRLRTFRWENYLPCE